MKNHIKQNLECLDLSLEKASEFNKKVRALKKYCPLAYKYLIFKIDKNDFLKFNDGMYEINLPTAKEFKFLYGQIKLKCFIENKKAIFDLEPSQFLLDGYKSELRTYKSIYYRNEKDKFKIDLMLKIKEELTWMKN